MIITTMGTSEAQKLIALSLGKIAMSRQQRGGINLHKNLLVASVLHKARTTYMMDNFQTLIANKKAQAEKEAAAKMVVETPEVSSTNSSDKSQTESMDVTVKSRGVTDCNRVNNYGAPSGERPEKRTDVSVNKENVVPDRNGSKVDLTTSVDSSVKCSDQHVKKSCVRDVNESSPVVTGKQPLSTHNGGDDYVSQSCRCAGGKRTPSFADNDSGTLPKKPRYEDDFENYSDSEYEAETKDHEKMQTEPTQVANLVTIFNSGFNGLLKEHQDSSQPKGGSGQVNVYVSADRSVSGHQYVLSEVSCATQFKDTVTVPTAIALAV